MKSHSETEASTSPSAPEPAMPDAKPVTAQTTTDPTTSSGAVAREPDVRIALTTHQEGGGFTVEIVLRNVAPGRTVVLQSHGPRSGRDRNLSPAERKHPGGRPRLYLPELLLKCLGDQQLRTQEWKELVKADYGISGSRFFDLLKPLRADQRVTCSPIDQRWSQTRSHSPSSSKPILNQW